MSNGTELHNEICKKFRNKNYSKEFIEKYTDEGCSKINKVVLEDIISNNNILIGYCDVVLDYDDNYGRQQKALIEVKSSADVINKDPQEVLRQIKKYRFYNKNFTKTFLIYTSEDSNDYCVDDEDLFTEEDITVVDIDDFVDSERARWLEIKSQEREEERKNEEEERKQREQERKKKEIERQKMLEIQIEKTKENEKSDKIKKIFGDILGGILIVAFLAIWIFIIGKKMLFGWYFSKMLAEPAFFGFFMFFVPLIGYVVITLFILYFIYIILFEL